MKIFSTIVKLILGVSIAALGLYFFLKDVDVDRLFIELRSIRISALVVSCGFVFLTLILRSIRWKFILPDTPGTSKKHLFSNISIGFMVNNILPARIGEAARAFILWRKNRFPAAVCIGTLILERMIDLIVFFIFFILPVLILPQCSSARLRLFAFVMCGIILFCIACMFLYARFQALTVRAGVWLLKRLPERFRDKPARIGRELASTLEWLHSGKRICAVVCLSFLTLLCYPAMLIFLAGNSGFPFGVLEGMFSQAFAAFGAAIPLAPGYVGTMHAVMFQGLSILGMDGDHARALVIVYHAINYIPITILGLYFLFRADLSLGEIINAKKKMIE